MKKISIIILLILVCSCSNSDDNTNSFNSDFNPPSWIQGTWGVVDTTIDYKQGLFKFTNNDFFNVLFNIEISQKEQIEQYRKLGTNSIVTEEITNSVYNFSIKTNYVTTTYKFKKIDATHISYELNGFVSTLEKL